MTPKEASRSLLQVWTHGRQADECFPIDCKSIAEGLGIVVQGADFAEEFQGGLFIDSEIKAILYNETIKEEGRKNFTIAHELGHFCLHKDRKDLKCTMDDLELISGAPHGKLIEQEANTFAASLLMPGWDIAMMIKGRTLDLNLIQELAIRYNTSLTATACRVVELTGAAAAIVMVEAGKISWCYSNSSFTGFFLKKGLPIQAEPIDSLSATQVNQEIWLPHLDYERWELFQSSFHMKNYNRSLIFISAKKI